MRKVPNGKPLTDAERTIRKHVIELHAVIQDALAAGWNGQRLQEPEPEALPSLDDHHSAIGVCPLPIRRPHLRTRRATEPVAVALCHLINRGSFHGGDLAERCADALTAHRAIDSAERAGIIERGIFQLSQLQRNFSGIHGLPGGGWDAIAGAWIKPSLGYHWLTKTTKWLEVFDIETMLAEGAW